VDDRNGAVMDVENGLTTSIEVASVVMVMVVQILREENVLTPKIEESTGTSVDPRLVKKKKQKKK